MRLLIVFMLCTWWFTPQTVQAKGEISLSPAIEKVVIENPEQPIQYTIFVTSSLERPEQVVFDVLPVSSVDTLGKPMIDESPDAFQRISQQVMLDPQKTVLLPQETVGISVTIHGKFLPPGGSYALITATLKENEDNRNQSQTSVVPIIASFLAIRNPNGEERRLSLGGLTWPRIPVTTRLHDQVEVSLENQGNVHIEPHGLVELTDMFNRLVSRGQLNENSHLIMPSTAKVLGVSMQSLRTSAPLAFYSLKATGADELGRTPFARTKRFLYISPWIVGFLAFITVVLLIQYKYPDFKPFKRRKNRKIQDLANRTSVNDVLEILHPQQ